MVVGHGGFVGVSKPLYRGRQDKWLVQNKPHGIWRYGFDTELEAAEWLAKQLKVKDVGELARDQPSHLLVVSRYVGVVVHERSAGGKPFFEARVHGKCVSCHISADAAAQVVAKKLGVRVESLKKKYPLTRRQANKLFRDSYAVFKKYMPGDLDNLLRLEGPNARTYSQELW